MGKNNSYRLIRKLSFRTCLSNLRKMYPSGEAKKQSISYFRRKITLFMLVIISGITIALAYEIKVYLSNELSEDNSIKRNDYQTGEKQVKVLVRDKYNGESGKISVTVSEKKYTEDQLNELSDEVIPIICKRVLSENISPDHISQNLSFPDSITGYPFSITWKCEDPLLIDKKGVINKERLRNLLRSKESEEGILTGIRAELRYDNYVKEISMFFNIFPMNTGEDFLLTEAAIEAIEQENKATSAEDYLVLPDSVGNRSVEYSEIKNKNSLIILVLSVIAAIAVFFREDEELKNKVKSREKQMLLDYPNIVNKFALFYFAGLNTKGIWEKICSDYRFHLETGGEVHYVYEEMLLTLGKMEDGLGELNAYEYFSDRCGIHKYRQFVNIIEQTSMKGRSDINALLEKEACDAFTERKNKAKELGEEAGTKLLLPMFMMLLVVLIIVMVPAFIAFKI